METRKAWFCQECRVEMNWNEEFHYYKCPECRVEVWVPDDAMEKEKKIHKSPKEISQQRKVENRLGDY